MKQVVMTAALLACTVMFAVAQTTLISANTVDYNRNVQDFAFLIKSTQFTGSRTVDEVLGAQLPLGSQVFVFDTDIGYFITTYEEDFLGQRAWSIPNLVVGVGEGFWYNNTSDSDLTWIVNKPYSDE